ncbi:MAG: TonB-dependent receptor [Steroidobacteraceae bacterium]
MALVLGMAGGILSQAVKAADADQLEEVVVTAEKREVNLQKVATSIQVKQGEELRAEGKQRIDEIMQGTVGIQAQDSRTGLTFFVRGVDSSTGNPGQSIVSPVAVLVDGVSQARSEAVRGGALDLSRAEIMRGPQSTTLGANAAAGAVSLVSNKPVLGEYQARGQVEIGNYSKRQVEGVFNAPLGSSTALRVAFSQDKRDGYISAGAGDSDLLSMRAKLRWQPNDNLDTVLTLSTQHIGGNGVQQSVLLAYGQWQPITQANAGSLQLTPGGCASTAPGVLVIGCPAIYWAQWGPVTPVGESFRQRKSAWDDGLPTLPNHPFRDSNIHLASVEITWKTGIGTLSVLPSIQYTDYDSREDEMAPGTSYMTESNKQVNPVVDVHLNSNPGGKLEWLVGANYNRDRTYNWWVGFIDFPSTLPSGVGGPPSFCYPPGAPVNQECFSYQNQPLTVRTSLSAFANGKYAIMDDLRLVAGARYSKDKAEQSTQAQVIGSAAGPDAAAAAAAGVHSGSGEWSKTTFRAGLEYDILRDTMVYAMYSTGYTPGRLGVSAPNGPPDTVTEATTIKQLSAGVKSQFFDRRVQLNADIFRTSYANRAVQGTVNAYLPGATASSCFPNPAAGGGPFGPPIAIGSTGGANPSYCMLIGQDMATVPNFVSLGLDLDGVWLITPNDRLSLTFEYLKAKYDSLPTVAGLDYTSAGIAALYAQQWAGQTLSQANADALSAAMGATLNGFVGAAPQNSPKTSFTVDFQHEFNLPGGSRLTPRVAAVYKSKYWSFGGAPGANVSEIIRDQSSANLAWQQAYTKWDAYLGWQSADGKLGVNAYVKNVGNEVILQNYTYPYVSLEPPRTVGLIINAQL